MSGRAPGLLLPGERRRGGARVGVLALGAWAGLLWLVLASAFLPALGFHALSFDPIIPLVAAFVLGGQRKEGLLLAIGLGAVADSLTGVGTSASTLQYLVVGLLAAPLEGHIVLRDRWLPALGVAVLAGLSGLVVLGFTAFLGVGRESPWHDLPQEALGTALVAALLWPLFRRLAGWRPGACLGLG